MVVLYVKLGKKKRKKKSTAGNELRTFLSK
jgi:hypothetical protein